MSVASEKRHPWFRFYTGDWRGDAGLRSVGFAARGLWMDMLSLMHEAVPYGHLVANDRAIDAARLAARIGGTQREVQQLLDILEAEGVFSRTDDGTIYSRRMVRDFEKAEQDRLNGKGGGNPAITNKTNDIPPDNGGGNQSLNGGVNPPDNQEDKAHARTCARVPLPESNTKGRKNPPLAPPQNGGAKKRGRISIPSDWEPDEQQRLFSTSAGLDPDATALNFRDFHLAQGKRLADVDAAWRLWCRVAAASGGHRKSMSEKSFLELIASGKDVAGDLVAEIEAERAARELEAERANRTTH